MAIRILAVIGFGLMLAACQTAAPATTSTVSDEQAFKLARGKLMDSLKDPDSAKIDPNMVHKRGGNFWIGGEQDIVCGRVNSNHGNDQWLKLIKHTFAITPRQCLSLRALSIEPVCATSYSPLNISA